MVGEAGRLINSEDQSRTGQVGLIWVTPRYLKAAYLGIAAGIDHVHVEKAVLREVRIERQAKQAALTGRGYLGGQIEERRSQDLIVVEIDNLDLPGLLHDEESIVIARGRNGIQGRRQARRNPSRSDRANLTLWPVRVEPIDQVLGRSAWKCVAAVITDDEIDICHCTMRK